MKRQRVNSIIWLATVCGCLVAGLAIVSCSKKTNARKPTAAGVPPDEAVPPPSSRKVQTAHDGTVTVEIFLSGSGGETIKLSGTPIKVVNEESLGAAIAAGWAVIAEAEVKAVGDSREIEDAYQGNSWMKTIFNATTAAEGYANIVTDADAKVSLKGLRADQYVLALASPSEKIAFLWAVSASESYEGKLVLTNQNQWVREGMTHAMARSSLTKIIMDNIEATARNAIAGGKLWNACRLAMRISSKPEKRDGILAEVAAALRQQAEDGLARGDCETACSRAEHAKIVADPEKAEALLAKISAKLPVESAVILKDFIRARAFANPIANHRLDPCIPDYERRMKLAKENMEHALQHLGEAEVRRALQRNGLDEETMNLEPRDGEAYKKALEIEKINRLLGIKRVVSESDSQQR